MGRGRFPRAGLIHPSVAAYDRSCTVLTADISVIGELVVSDSRVRAAKPIHFQSKSAELGVPINMH